MYNDTCQTIKSVSDAVACESNTIESSKIYKILVYNNETCLQVYWRTANQKQNNNNIFVKIAIITKRLFFSTTCTYIHNVSECGHRCWGKQY